ncbi:GTP 3',8-cyclase MoaA [Chryseobacterium sp. CT-SW4]|uniref:GTP 3',8-cyclase MoaA n=1 Tax=Chryseobacterium sp. SW-1 TaxID=3157343 RepID=UPI003B016EB9
MKKIMNTDLLDSFKRKHDYLRLSITDSCNFRCLYCMPDEPFKTTPSIELMSSEEIFEISKTFVEKFNINKIRITGGEPLVRHDFAQIIEQLSTLGVNIGITTNGVLLHKYFDLFQQYGIKDLNISIDSLNAEKFKYITKRNLFQTVWTHIKESIRRGFNVKLNIVVMRGFNEDEIAEFVALSYHYPIEVRFIEFMPFTGNIWEKEKVIPVREMLDLVSDHFTYEKVQDGKHDTSSKYKVKGDSKGLFAFISTMSNAFCTGCNRIRITSDGKMKNCLFGAEEFDVLQLYRNGENIEELIKEGILRKHKEKGGQFSTLETTGNTKITNRSMIKIGG